MWVVAVMPLALLALPIGLQILESRLLGGPAPARPAPARPAPARTGPAGVAPSPVPSARPSRSVDRGPSARPAEHRPRTLAV